jgi:hypothetical protein
MGFSMGMASATWDLFPLWCTFLLIYLTVKLLLPEQPLWRRFLLLLLASAWAPRDLRVCLGALLFAASLVGWYALRRGKLQPVTIGLGGAVLGVVAFLYSADTGAYALAGWLVSLAGILWEDRHQEQPLGKYGAALLVFAIASFFLILATNAVLATPLNFHFWKNSLLIIGAHRWLLPFAMSKAGTIYVSGVLLMGSAVFLFAGFVGRGAAESVIAVRPGFLLSAFTFSVILLQRALVRSDRYHVSGGVFAMMLFTGVILFSFRSPRWPALAALAGVTCWLLSSRMALMPDTTFNPLGVPDQYRQALNPITQCPDPLKAFNGGCYWPVFAGNMRASANFLDLHTAPDDPVAIFPYQTIYAVAANRNSAGGLLLSYLASGAYLSQLELLPLKQNPPPAALYLTDSRPIFLIDDVSNFTRSPELWLWLFQNYRSERQLRPDIYGLVKDNSRAAQISLRATALQVTAQRYPIRERKTVIDLGPPAWPAEGADFLRLRLTVHYSPMWQLRKPEQIQLEIARADGTTELRPFVIEPNHPSDIWFYPWNQLDLGDYFAGDQAVWRTAQRSPITHLRLQVAPLDWLSQRPDWIQVDSADAVKAHLPVAESHPK